MPRFLLTVSLPKGIQQLCMTCALITDKTLQWAESRKNALTALSLVCTTVGIAPSSPGGVDQVTLAVIFRTLIDGLEGITRIDYEVVYLVVYATSIRSPSK
ncbi:hypothetical protein DAPPUDRAFT_248358 [Daphnia pulex]|uniref:Uncharacterized protein n=1 Tax=Daphnia pulex TaxID=6669 RepID=E9GU87_DAPPU|nr:hypothetical protein DAPPUDRAFT_248358 [Daphnia pulex]|eukprot:EFX77016.1 hypothetical protein DAPPUDRAFT_248358 [Daphnia pulex]